MKLLSFWRRQSCLLVEGNPLKLFRAPKGGKRTQGMADLTYQSIFCGLVFEIVGRDVRQTRAERFLLSRRQLGAWRLRLPVLLRDHDAGDEAWMRKTRAMTQMTQVTQIITHYNFFVLPLSHTLLLYPYSPHRWRCWDFCDSSLFASPVTSHKAR